MSRARPERRFNHTQANTSPTRVRTTMASAEDSKGKLTTEGVEGGY